MRWNTLFAQSKNPLVLVSLFLLFSLSLILFKIQADLWKIAFAFPLCFWMSFKGGTKGFFAALMIFAFGMYFTPQLHHGWGMSFAVSVAISFFLVLRTSQDAIQSDQEKEKAFHASEDTVCQLQNQLKSAISFAIQEKKEEQEELESLRKELLLSQKEKEVLAFEFKVKLNAHEQKRSSLENALEEAKKEIETLKQQLEHHPKEREWLDALNEARVSQFQLSLFKEAYEQREADHWMKEKVLSEEVQKMSDQLKQMKIQLQEKQEIEERLRTNAQLYRQLREQFDEKSETLHQTRKELFEVEGKLITLQKESEQKIFDFPPDEFSLFEQFKEIEEERDHLESEIKDLQDLVSVLLLRKKASKNRKSKAKKEDRVPDLELNFS
jgi:chromosome segregation ATPase